MTQAAPVSGELDWLVNDFAQRIAGVSHALVVSADGLKLAVSARVDEAHADQLAAVASGLASLTLGAARCFHAEPVSQTIVEMRGGYLFVTSVGDGSALAVFAAPECDIGMIGYEMTLLVARAGKLLSSPVRLGSEHSRYR
jgi:predicted regulator of Ras-like GTPase activity (Roadblock/LC7/MglB family)